jgi:hypothetical protein
MFKIIGEILIPHHRWAEKESTVQHNLTYTINIR